MRRFSAAGVLLGVLIVITACVAPPASAPIDPPPAAPSPEPVPHGPVSTSAASLVEATTTTTAAVGGVDTITAMDPWVPPADTVPDTTASTTTSTTTAAPPVTTTIAPTTTTTTTVPPVATGTGAVMAPSRVSAAQLVAWFRSRNITDARPPVPIDDLARMFIEEGDLEGVTGDVAFVQSILETGWFRFPDTGQVRPWYNNFAGIGAVDGGSSPAQFPDARTGVRAQIQHLRAYADPTVTVASLHAPLVDPRFDLVRPKGKAPLWSQFGNGIWASSTEYAAKIESLYAQLQAFVSG
jgi:Mannosyl-glycoprotein endo-beta-N-acetylglucosaminidase